MPPLIRSMYARSETTRKGQYDIAIIRCWNRAYPEFSHFARGSLFFRNPYIRFYNAFGLLYPRIPSYRTYHSAEYASPLTPLSQCRSRYLQS